MFEDSIFPQQNFTPTVSMGSVIRRDICSAAASYTLIVAKKRKRRLDSQHLKERVLQSMLQCFSNLLDYQPLLQMTHTVSRGLQAQHVVL